VLVRCTYILWDCTPKNTFFLYSGRSKTFKSVDDWRSFFYSHNTFSHTHTYIWGRVCKYVTNGSKTAVIGIIGFLCASLSSSTTQLHDSLGSRRACTEAGFSSQNGDRALSVHHQRAALCCALFCGKNDSMQRIFIKKCFLFTMGSVCCIKWFTTGSRNSLKNVRKLQMMPNKGEEVAGTTVKRLPCCGFWCTGKAMGHVYRMFYILYVWPIYRISVVMRK
jgi:hypothetical protein